MSVGDQADPELLGRAERRRLAALLADAFEDDPMQRWLFPNDRRRHRRLRRFYELDLRHRLEGRCAVDLDRMAGVAFWHPPGDGATVPVRAAVRLAPALVSVAAHHPVAAALTLAAVARRRPREPHWYLSHLAVAPRAQGQGVGGRLLHAGVSRAARDHVGVYLETANPSNLTFYAARGFAEVGVVEVGSAPPVWLLWRRPEARDTLRDTEHFAGVLIARRGPPFRGGPASTCWR